MTYDLEEGYDYVQFNSIGRKYNGTGSVVTQVDVIDDNWVIKLYSDQGIVKSGFTIHYNL
jgi:hypothetical protein